MIPADEIEELVLPEPKLPSDMRQVPKPFREWIRRAFESGCVITAHSDAQTLTFGTGLSYEALRDLHTRLLRMLTG